MFCAALLAGFGADALTRDIKRVALYCYLSAFAIFCGGVYFLSPSPPGRIAAEGARNIHYGLTTAFVLLVGATLIITLSVHLQQYRKFFLFALLVVTFADLYLHFSDAVFIGIKENPGVYEVAPEAITTIKANAGIASSNTPDTELNDSELNNGLFRVYTKPEGVQGSAPFGFNRAMIFRTFLVEGFEPLDLSRHRQLVSTLSAKNLDNLLKITNSRYITNIETGILTGQYYPNSLPRAYIVSKAQFMENDVRILERLAVNDPSVEVVIAGKGKDVSGETMTAAEWNVQVVSYTGNRVDIRTKSQKNGFLVLSDAYYPNWQAKIDGAASPVMRANYDFRAVFLPKGEHTVVFEYHPRYLVIGIVSSVLAVLIVIICMILARKGRGEGLEMV
jgi:hypothetical protein